MKFQNPLLVVTDMEVSKRFYKEVLGLEVILDFGANVTLTGGVCLQTKETWMDFIGAKENEIIFCGKNAELYFEEDDFDAFADKLNSLNCVEYVHPVIEHRWGQRVVRFYDPDGHIIEVGENIKAVTRRFLDSGMTEEEVAVRMDVPLEFVRNCKE